MKTLLHVLARAARGGCEWDAFCIIQQTPQCTHEVLVMADCGEMSREFELAGAVVRHLKVLGQSSRSVVLAIREEVLRYQPQGVLVWHGMVLLPEILHALHDFTGRVLVHGGNPAHSLPRWVDWRYRLREWWLGKRCDATYVCCSQYVANSFAHSFYLRRFPRVVVPNGVRSLTGSPHEPKEIAPGASFTVGMVARLDAIKDHATLLRAFAEIRREWPAARLEFAGDGELRPSLEALAVELGMAGSVRFLGMVSDVYAAMALWDVFAYAATIREGFGNAVAEALMLGLPCVVSDLDPIREVCGNEGTVDYVPSGESAAMAAAIQALIPDLERRKRLSLAGRKWALAELGADVYSQRYVTLLGEEQARERFTKNRTANWEKIP